MRIVITGPPCSGKSSLIDFIDQNQYKGTKETFELVPEVARETFSFLEKHEPEKMEDFTFRQQLLETLQIWNFVNNEHAIFDRGLPDEFAYRVFFGETKNTTIWNKCRQFKYDMVFILPFWHEIYEQDEIRKETVEEAQKLEMLLTHSYISCGYNPILVPKVSIEERIDFIYACINPKSVKGNIVRSENQIGGITAHTVNITHNFQ
jgi:predicted ATPase